MFLDIDGPLNVCYRKHDQYGSLFHPHFIENLRYVIEKTGCKLVISSSWRKNGLKEMIDMWLFRELPGEVIDVTPSLRLKKGGCIAFWNDKLTEQPTPHISGYSIPRGCEIEYWLENETEKFGEIENFVIVDDDSDFLLNQKDNFVRCSENYEHEDHIEGYGLTKQCALKCVQILNKTGLDLNLLEEKLDESLSNETKESLTDFIMSIRNVK